MIIWIFVKKSSPILSGIKALIMNPHIFSNSTRISLLSPLLSISHPTNGLPSHLLLTDDQVSTHSQSANERPVFPSSTNQKPWLRQLKCIAGGRSRVEQTIKTARSETQTQPCAANTRSCSCKILAGRSELQSGDEHVTRSAKIPARWSFRQPRLSIKHGPPAAGRRGSWNKQISRYHS